ncbi:MAG: thioredoxin [Bacteroidales bacterium]|jgi:thioredoxin 1|nr:thioredoxin [Bacteroidales bacterium]
MNYYFWIPIAILAVLLVAALYKRYKLLKNLADMPENENVIKLTDDTFEKTTAIGISLIDFWAPWCAPCKMLAPTINELADEFGERVNICKMNVDENRKTSAVLKIRSIPTVIIMQNGAIAGHFVGVKPKYVYAKALKELV